MIVSPRCLICNQENPIQQKPAPHRKYCSRLCGDRAKNIRRRSKHLKILSKDCKFCSKQFLTHMKNKKYCNDECFRNYYTRTNDKVVFKALITHFKDLNSLHNLNIEELKSERAFSLTQCLK